MITRHDADDLGRFAANGLQRCSESRTVLVELPPGQRAELVDESRAVRAALGRNGESGRDRHADPAHGCSHPEVPVGSHWREHARAIHRCDEAPRSERYVAA